MFTGLAAGFAVNANLRDLFPGSGVRAGILAVSLFAVANALGRILWGGLFDRVSARGVLRANLLCQAAVLLCGPWFLDSEPGLIAFACLTGLNYGGVLVIYASSSARIWGNENVGQVYGWLFSSNVLAALAPLLAGLAYDLSGEFTTVLRVIGALLLAAAIGMGRAGAGE
jgi:OFA family oxalate/formate antiporter-like MFS transporter